MACQLRLNALLISPKLQQGGEDGAITGGGDPQKSTILIEKMLVMYALGFRKHLDEELP